MPDSRETKQGGFGAFAEIDRERRAARELAAWDAAFAAACPAASPAPVADRDGARTDALTSPTHCAWRELNEAEPHRIEETHADRKRRRG